jgi:hypothetical protein
MLDNEKSGTQNGGGAETQENAEASQLENVIRPNSVNPAVNSIIYEVTNRIRALKDKESELSNLEARINQLRSEISTLRSDLENDPNASAILSITGAVIAPRPTVQVPGIVRRGKTIMEVTAFMAEAGGTMSVRAFKAKFKEKELGQPSAFIFQQKDKLLQVNPDDTISLRK